VARRISPKQVVVFALSDGSEPFVTWLWGLKDSEGRRRILVRLTRLEQGHFGDCASVGEGVFELRLFFGSGYRVYFGEDAERIVVLFCGGDKKTQKKDIKQAQIYWKEYLK